MIVGVIISGLRIFLPDLDVPEDFQDVVAGVINGIMVIVAVALGWLRKESQAKVDELDTV